MAVAALSVVVAATAPVIAPYDPISTDLTSRALPPAFVTGGHIAHILGTDRLGRDILSRVIYGAQISLFIATITIALSVFCRTSSL